MLSHSCRPKRVGTLGLLPCLFSLAVAGCYHPPTQPTAGRKPVYPVRGSVFVDGRPAVGAFVVFYPEHERDEFQEPAPRATVQPDGSFRLSTYEAADGAPAGTYVVSVVWDPGGRDEGDRLCGLYADRRCPKFKTVVLKTPNDLPPFNLRLPEGAHGRD